MPSQTGFDLGSATQRWDAFIQQMTVGWWNNVRIVDGNQFTTIQDALDAATSGTVYVPNGTYVTDGITFNNDDTNLVFESPLAIIKRTDSFNSGHLVTVSGRSNIRIVNGTIDGNKVNNAGALFNLIVTGSSNVVVDGVESINSPNAGIDLRLNTDNATNDSRSRITNCRIINNDVDGIQLTNVHRVDVDHNLVDNSGQVGIQLEGLADNVNDDISITHNQVYNTIVGDGINIAWNQDPDPRLSTPFSKRVHVTNNIVGNSGFNGIAMQGDESIVEGNTVYDGGSGLGQQGILCTGTDIAIKGNTVSGGTGVGIDCVLSTRVTVSGNVVFSNDSQGIEFNGSIEGSISFNTLWDNMQVAGIGASERAAIIVHNNAAVANPDKVIVSGNIVLNGTNQEYGILIKDDVDQVVVTGNIAISTGSIRDISIETSGNLLFLSDNMISGTGSIASAATITIPDVGSHFTITGTTNVSTINSAGGQLWTNRKITLEFSGVLTVIDATGNLRLAGPFATAADDTLTLISDGTNWKELSRSSNTNAFLLNPLEGMLSNTPRWIFKQVDNSDMAGFFATAATFTLWTLPANTMIHDVVGIVVQGWVGPGLTAAVCSVGRQTGSANDLTLDDDFFAAGTVYNLHDATANGGKGSLLFDPTDKFAPFMFVAGGVVELQMDLTGADHNTTTGGQARIYMLVSQPLANTITEAN